MTLLEQMLEHIKSPEFLTYVEAFPDSYDQARLATQVSIDEPGTDVQALGRFYQRLWEALPDAPGIRFGAFYKICDFAEAYCFPSADEEAS